MESEKKYIEVDVLDQDLDHIGSIPVQKKSYDHVIRIIGDYKVCFITNEDWNVFELHSKYYGASGYYYNALDQQIN